MKTEKLFYEDARQVTFTAKVLACEENQGAYWIQLDRTGFFPEEGGQYADRGVLNGLEVLDVQIKQDVIYHKLAQPIALETVVEGEVSWQNRFDRMQQHTGEHIISGLVNRHFGYDNVGFHLGHEEVTLDFNGLLTYADAEKLEQEANEAVAANLEVLVTIPPAKELALLSYRSKLALTGDVRIVDIPGYDRCACCAPHVQRTGEIGLIKITGVIKHRGGVRVNILCGMRALADYRSKENSVSEISVLLSARPDAVSAAVKRLQQEYQALHSRLCSMQEQLMLQRIEALDANQLHVLLFEADLDSVAMRKAVNKLTGRFQGFCAVFVGDDTHGYRYILGSSSLDCQTISVRLRDQFSARGGGSAAMIQGSVLATEETLRHFFAQPSNVS